MTAPAPSAPSPPPESGAPDRAPRRRWRRAFLVLLLVLLIPLLGLPAFLVVERVRGQVSLGRYRRVLRAQGEPRTARDLQNPLPAGENGAPELIAAASALTNSQVLPKHPPSRMRLTASGHAIVGFSEDAWADVGVTNRWEQLAADLKANEPVLQRVRDALAKPVLDNHLDYSLGPKVPITHLSVTRKLCHWFGAGAQLGLRDGKTQEALPPLLHELQLLRLLERDQLIISELVRIALAAIARTDAWEALQASPWTDADLARLQQAWERLSFLPNLERALDGEQVFCEIGFDSMRRSYRETVATMYGLEELLPVEDSARPAWERVAADLPGGKAATDFLKRQVYCRAWRFAWLDQDERRYLGQMQQYRDLTHLAVKEKSLVAIQAPLGAFEAAVSPRSVYGRLRFPDPQLASGLSRTVVRALRAETERSLVLCAIGLKRHELRLGKLPMTLAALVPEFLAAVPTDYMDGKPIRYRLLSGGDFLLYSVGEDGRDDGGSVELRPDKSGPGQLWNRKDVVWPMPATFEETEEYRQHPDRY